MKMNSSSESEIDTNSTNSNISDPASQFSFRTPSYVFNSSATNINSVAYTCSISNLTNRNTSSSTLDSTTISSSPRNESSRINTENPLVAHFSYLAVSLSSAASSNSVSTEGATPSVSRASSCTLSNFSLPLPPTHIRSSQSRPCSPPPATYFPPPRRPSVSLPPSPLSARVHRASMPSHPFLPSTLRVSSHSSHGTCPTMASPSNPRPRTPTPPPLGRRSPRRRSTRTPSPRPPLPLPADAHPPVPQPHPQQPQRNRCESQPYKSKMRGR